MSYKKEEEVLSRTIFIGGAQQEKFVSNKVSTTKYSPLTFLPKNLFEQFRRVANLYFLLIAILQSFPGLSTIDPITSILPLVFVVLVSMVKELVEDLRRASSDKKANGKKCLVWNGTSYVQKKWKDIAVGDFVKIESDESFPADILVIASPLTEGECNIETTNLDGETNLKTKKAVAFPLSASTIEANPGSINGRFEFDLPNANLHVFNGSITYSDSTKIPVDNINIIYRSCSLRNTPWIVGVVVYTGHETKIMKNSGKTPLKQTKLEILLNVFVFIAFGFQLLFCLFCSIMYGVFLSTNKTHTYLGITDYNYFAVCALQFLRFVILFNTLIPISLYVTLEVVKLGQVLFINNDLRMYDEKSNTRANARTSNLNETLGNIEYVFSDKTGTLTQNVMEFFKCSIAGHVYGTGISEIKASEMKRRGDINAKPTLRGFEDPELENMLKNADLMKELEKEKQERNNETVGAEAISPDEQSNNKDTIHSENIKKLEAAQTFFLTLALCHTCVAEIPKKKGMNGEIIKKEEKKKDMFPWEYNGTLSYKAASPDEGALVSAAAKLGFDFRGKNGDLYYVRLPLSFAKKFMTEEQINNEINKTTSSSNGEIQMTIESNSNTSDSSINMPSSQSINSESLVSRNNTLPNSDPSSYSSSSDVTESSFLQNSSTNSSDTEGTIIVPFKVLNVLEFNSDRKRNSIIVQHPNGEIWMYSKGADSVMFPLISRENINTAMANATVTDMCAFAEEGLRTLVIARRKVDPAEYYEWEPKYKAALNSMQDRQKNIDDTATLMEHDFELLGATAIEDMLQHGVPDCIEMLRRAGIKVWVLTGDKQETAINIGYACNLLTSDMKVMCISGSNNSKIRNHVAALSHFFATIPSSHFMHYGLVIEGSALSYCISDELISETLSVCLKCGVVICCRVSPKQKADVVGAIKDNTTACTLAIGDGANDVPMIQRAHVGVGISGNEGMQAVMSSDYSIAQFRFLQRLLLVHGRVSYKRLAVVVLYSFYKNFAFVLTEFWFAWHSGFSAQSLFESWYISMFNCVFTVAPIGVFGLGDQEIKINTIMRLPATYALGRLGREATPYTFVCWIADGLYSSFVIFYLSIIILEDCVQSDGTAGDLYYMGTTICTSVIFTVTLRLFLEFNYVTWIHLLIVFLSILAWYVVAFIFDTGLLKPQMIGSASTMFLSFHSWLSIFVCCVASVIPSYAVKYLKTRFHPSVDFVLRERELLLRPKKIKEVERMRHNAHRVMKTEKGMNLQDSLLNKDGSNALAETTGEVMTTVSTSKNLEEGNAGYIDSEQLKLEESISLADGTYDDLLLFEEREKSILDRLTFGTSEKSAEPEIEGQSVERKTTTSSSSSSSSSSSTVFGVVTTKAVGLTKKVTKTTDYLFLDNPSVIGRYLGYDFTYTESARESEQSRRRNENRFARFFGRSPSVKEKV